MNNKELKKYIGHDWQDTVAMRIQIPDGKAGNCKAILLENPTGLSMTVLEERCLDIFSLKIKGFNIPFLSKCGIVHPSFYDSTDWEWLRSFGVGFLTTCGLTQAGEPCRYNNTAWGLHGVISNTPAENVSIVSVDDEIVVSGIIRQYKFQSEDLILERNIRMNKCKNQIRISDRITNEGWKETPFMLLYHFNFGYPLLNEDSDVLLPTAKIEGWDEYSNLVIDQHLKMNPPDALYNEQTFIHKLDYSQTKTSFMIADSIKSPRFSVHFEYDAQNLPYLTQWKHFKPSEYVMSIEPCNNHVRGAQWESENGTLKQLKPGESKDMDFTICFMDDPAEIRKMKSVCEQK